jgi:putative glutamine amidotransferase
MPVLVPAIGERADIEGLLDSLDGLLLPGSPSNIAPEHYGGAAPRPDNQDDPARDATVLPLIRRAIARELPILALCRGIQELNVAHGGSLHQHVHELPGRIDHRSDKTKDHAGRYGHAHEVELTPGGRLAQLYRGRRRIEVNSLHAQAIDRLADGFVVEARAPDGTVEAISSTEPGSFLIGVQWHPEWRAREIPDHRILFEAFGDACRAYQGMRIAHARPRSVA